MTRAETQDWAKLDAAARERAKVPLRAGEPDKRPFWNTYARAFIHPPAFELKEVPGAERYRLEIAPDAAQAPTTADTSTRDAGTSKLSTSTAGDRRLPQSIAPIVWLAEKPWLPIDPEIWDTLPPGYYELRAEALGPGGTSLGTAGSRKFYRAAVFAGPYPAAPRSYREAAERVYAAVAALPQVRGWLHSDTPPEGYDLYCYPTKILGSMIRALCRLASERSAAGDAAAKDELLEIARKMADWLIAEAEPEGAPLAHFTQTYWGNRRRVAVENAGRIMLSYPAQAALAFFDLAETLESDGTPDAHYRASALEIARTYVRLQGGDGTWPLLVRAADGASLCPNRIVPDRYILEMFDRAEAASESEAPIFAAARDRAFAYVESAALATWNWDGQFEDSKPRPPYQNLQKGVAIDTAVRLFALGRVAEGRECVDWCEDQFTAWSEPIHHMDWAHWKLPTALEQYDYYTPIDASMADMVRGFSAAFTATGDPLYGAKAKAMADCLVRHQRADGTIPTYFDERGAGSDWVNCMIYSASALEAAADAGVDAASP